jgi:hypothetical protein
LLRAGADVEAADYEGKQPVDYTNDQEDNAYDLNVRRLLLACEGHH